jgi:hypothetical protein
MCFINRQFIVLAPLLFVMTAQAAPKNQPAQNGKPVTPMQAPEPRTSAAGGAANSSENLGLKEIMIGGRRYGIGFEARQAIGSGEHGDPDSRIERLEHDSHGR